MTTVLIVLFLLLGYLIGALPTGYLVVKRMTGQDIRQIGSGGTGATNVRRVVGKQAALFVLLVDFHKGFIPVVLAQKCLPGHYWVHIAVALLAMVGHSRSIFLGFTGGKSAATGLGAMLALSWPVALICGVMAYLLTKTTKIQAIGSLTATLLSPVLAYFFHIPKAYLVFTILSAVMVTYLHKGNIIRLIRGRENSI